MVLRIVTWNINSVRLRHANLAKLVRHHRPDIVCLQETKVENQHFPLAAIRKLGFPHVHFRGMKGYNGVAILSRQPVKALPAESWGGKDDCRHIAVRLEGGIELHNAYVPAGGDIPDPVANDKFAHKLRFLDDMTAWFAATRRRRTKMILVGDLNVAPLPNDVWSHRQLLDVVSHTPIEVEKLSRLQETLDWVDAARRFVPASEKLYSWWSYRARDWAASDRGRRLDHVWVTPPLARHLAGVGTLREARGWAGPSDHVPVILDLA